VLNLYSIFHLNLMYSSMEIEDRPEIIKKCYFPMLNLADSFKVPMGIELSGYTLEQINKHAPDWSEKLRRLLRERKADLIGSGYVQTIGPLVPAEVNSWNQKLGLDVYEKILGIRPQIAYVNEQAYSAGLVEHYINGGYKAIIMEWNNSARFHPEWSKNWRYFPQSVCGPSGENITLIWNDSIAFQKFQRYVHGEIELKEYLSFLDGHTGDSIRVFPVYGSDVEVFDFRPGRYNTESKVCLRAEWERIQGLFEILKGDDRFQLILPSGVSDLMDQMGAGELLKLESPEQPIPIKKQEKYNINRWALTGRGDLEINTKCYRIYDAFRKAELNKPSEEDWKELCYLWSSDFRTHITQKRWDAYLLKLNRFCKKWRMQQNLFLAKPSKKATKLPCLDKNFKVWDDTRYLMIETKSMKCVLNKVKGLAIDNLWFKNISTEPLIGTLPHGYYDDISLGADFYSGHAIIEKPGEHKITSLKKCEPQAILEDGSLLSIRVETQDEEVEFKKEYLFDVFAHSLTINMSIDIPGRVLSTIHPLNITFIPTSFQKESLFYATHNGGKSLEKFKVGGREIHHSQSLSALISAKYGLGATEGLVIVGNEQIQLVFQHDQRKSAIIPAIYFLPLDNEQYFLRLQYSAQEIDETFKKNEASCNFNFSWKISV